MLRNEVGPNQKHVLTLTPELKKMKMKEASVWSAELQRLEVQLISKGLKKFKNVVTKKFFCCSSISLALDSENLTPVTPIYEVSMLLIPQLEMFVCSFIFIIFKIFIKVQLIYNVVLISDVLQSDSVI